MSMIATHSTHQNRDRFEPDANLDPQDQRRLRGHLEQIDYAAFAANREVLGKTVGDVDITTFEKLAVTAAIARGKWVAAAIKLTGLTNAPTPEQLAHLGVLRHAYEELTDAYGALRRMVERGYLPYRTKP